MRKLIEILNTPKNMLQAVIDTNVLVRALLRSGGSDRAIIEGFKNGNFELLYSQELLKELARVLSYPRISEKYHLDSHSVKTFIKTIVALGKIVSSPEKVKICRDPNDDEIFSIALAIVHKKPIYIVSGDKDILSLKGKVKGVEIVTASDFVKVVSANFSTSLGFCQRK